MTTARLGPVHTSARSRLRVAVVITAEVWSTVVRFVGEGGRPGSAFMSQIEPDRWVLITAKHLCNGDSEEIVTLRHPYAHSGAPVQSVGLDQWRRIHQAGRAMTATTT